MKTDLTETFPKGYVEVRNSSKIKRKFYAMAILGVFIEGMIYFFLFMMRMDDSVEWTGKLQFYVGAAAVLPLVIIAAGIAGAWMTSKQCICFDAETIFLNMKFCSQKKVKWSELGGMVRTGNIGFILVDKTGKNITVADITMTNYNAFYNMAIRQCKDYEKEQIKEQTGAVPANSGRLGMEPGYIVVAVLSCFGISAFMMAGIVELFHRYLEIERFVESLSAGKVFLMIAFLPAAALCVCLPLQRRRYWTYSDYGLELCYVFRKKEQLSWTQIRRVQIKVMKTQQGENYGFVLYTSSEKFASGKLLTKGNRNFRLQVEQMSKKYGFEVARG